MNSAAVSTVDPGPRQVSRRVTVAAPAAEVFALIADPHRHPELDGSGTVRDTPVSGPHRLGQDATFTVGMKVGVVPYSITSTVTAYEDGQLVEWRHPMGHHWRWELVELGPSRTQVTETFDYREAKAPRMLELFGLPRTNGAGITKTLEGLVARFS